MRPEPRDSFISLTTIPEPQRLHSLKWVSYCMESGRSNIHWAESDLIKTGHRESPGLAVRYGIYERPVGPTGIRLQRLTQCLFMILGLVRAIYKSH